MSAIPDPATRVRIGLRYSIGLLVSENCPTNVQQMWKKNVKENVQQMFDKYQKNFRKMSGKNVQQKSNKCPKNVQKMSEKKSETCQKNYQQKSDKSPAVFKAQMYPRWSGNWEADLNVFAHRVQQHFST